MTTEQRLERLERENRWMRRLGAVGIPMRILALLVLVSLAFAEEPAASIHLLLSKPRSPTADQFVAALKATGIVEPEELEKLRAAFRSDEPFACTLLGRIYRITYTKKSAYYNRADALSLEKDKKKRAVIRNHRGHIALAAKERGDLRAHYLTLAKLAAALWDEDVMGVRFSWVLLPTAPETKEKLLAKDPLKAFELADTLLKEEPKLDPIDEAFRDAAFEAHLQFPKFKRMCRLHAQKKDDIDNFCVYIGDPKRPHALIRLLVTKIKGTKISGYRVDASGGVEKYDPAREAQTELIWILDWTYKDGAKTVGDFRRKELEKRGLIEKAEPGQ